MGRFTSHLYRALGLLGLAALLAGASALCAQGVHIRIAGGVPPDRQMLSARADGDWVDLWGVDDRSGRQRWIIEPVPGSRYVRIRVSDGTPYNRRLLSVSGDGSKVDLWSDDGSGRQLWEIERIPGSRYVHIRVAGGTPRDRQLLSVYPNGDRIDLFSHDDGSGHQQWIIEDGYGRGDDRDRRWDYNRPPPPPDDRRYR
jgi:hypothetical protein